jgi:hypothetical protein
LISLIGAVLLAILISPGLRAQNIIRNAGFESPLFDSDADGRIDIPMAVGPEPPPNHLDDWDLITPGTTGAVIRANYDPSHATFLAPQVGQQLFFMEINGQSSTIQQTGLSLTAGVTYYFSFYLSGLQNAPNAEIAASFTDGSDFLSSTFDVTATGWVQQTFSFLPANTADYTLSLTSPSGFYSNIDDLRLATTPPPLPGPSIPEPADYVMIAGVAALGLAAWRRRHVLRGG